jgi:hypothetical protein
MIYILQYKYFMQSIQCCAVKKRLTIIWQAYNKVTMVSPGSSFEEKSWKFQIKNNLHNLFTYITQSYLFVEYTTKFYIS